MPIKGKLNVDTKNNSKQNTSIPKNTHISLTLMSIYINKIYTPNNIRCAIRKHSYAAEAKVFLCVKYKWTSKTFDNIGWKLNSFTLMNMSYLQWRTRIRFMNHWLSIGKMQFIAPYPCPYFTQIFNQSSDYDHFLTCKKSKPNRAKRIENL